MRKPTTQEIRSFSKNESLVNKRRDQILEGAFKVFIQQGFKATKLRDIAEASGMPEGTIYRYISSKDDILHLICVKYARGRERLNEILTGAGNVSVTDTLRACLRGYFQTCDRGREHNLFFNREIHYFSHEDRRFLLEAQIGVTHFFKDLLDKGIQAGEFQMKSSLAVAHNILMLGHDWGLRRWFLSRHFTLEEYSEIQIELLFKQITTDCNGQGR